MDGLIMTTQNKNIVSEHEIIIQGQTVRAYRINNDVNGNPRYVVHFSDLGIPLSDYGKVPGLVKYRAKWFGGGYVFQSYNIESDLIFYADMAKEFYNKKEVK